MRRANEQRYWTGTEWSGRRRWVVDWWLPLDEAPERASPVGRSAPNTSRRSWWIAAAAACVIAAGAA